VIHESVIYEQAGFKMRLFDIKKHSKFQSKDGTPLYVTLSLENDKLEFHFAASGNRPVGSMTATVNSGVGFIDTMRIPVKTDRRYAAGFIRTSAVLARGLRIDLVANTNRLIPKGTVERIRRKMFTRLSRVFKSGGFNFISTYTLEFTAAVKPVEVLDLSVLEKPTKFLTYEDIKKPKHFWQALDEEQLAKYKERCFRVFRKEGFPYVSTSKAVRDNWLRALARTNINLITGDDIGQNLVGLSLAWSFHPHAWSVPCNKNFMTVMDAFNNDDKLRLLVQRLLDYYPAMTKTNLFGRIKMLSGVQGVSNFRPTAAAALYEYFGGGVIQDMSGGWGGRMLGAYRAPSVRRYIATEPSKLTHAGLAEQAEYLVGRQLFNQKSYEVHCLGSEVFRPDRNSVDFAFTSPPYFNCEQYAEEETQSFIKFPQYDAWADGFLGGTFENVYRGLKPGGHMAINIANVKGASKIEEDTVRVAKERGFKYIKTMYLLLSAQKAGFKREPVFVFQRPHTTSQRK